MQDDCLNDTTEISLTRRSIYLVPNFLTTIALSSGFFAIIAGIDNHFNMSVIAVYLAMIMDSLDGRIARLTRTQSPFGAQYDSLSDMVSFGLAPAIVAYLWCLKDLGRIGWAVAFLYMVCTALRLARFNTKLKKSKDTTSYFRGLPCPSAAAVVMGFIGISENNFIISSQSSIWLLVIFMLLVGGLMVSNFRYYSCKSLDFRGKVALVTLLAIIVWLVFIALDPFIILFATFLCYSLLGPIQASWRQLKHDKQ